MIRIQSNSQLIEDGYMHGPVDASRQLALATDLKGRPLIFSRGTDGYGYLIVRSADSETGWRQENLGVPGAKFDLLAAGSTADGKIVVCAAERTSRKLHVRSQKKPGSISWTPWHSIEPGPDIAGDIESYAQILIRPKGMTEAELLILYQQRLQDPDWSYTYRIGRADSAATSWSIAFNTDVLLQGFPKEAPTMALASLNSQAALVVSIPERGRIVAWLDIDRGTTSATLGEFGVGSGITRVFAGGAGGDSHVFFAGRIGDKAGVYAVRERQAVLLAESVPFIDAAVVFNETSGYYLMLIGANGLLYHSQGDVSGRTWQSLQAIDRPGATAQISGIDTKAEGAVFIETTPRHELRYWVRSPIQRDWTSSPVAVEFTAGQRVMWYTTTFTTVGDRGRAQPMVELEITAPETTEIIIANETEIVGPTRPLRTASSAVGLVTIRQRTELLSNMAAADLSVSVIESPPAAQAVAVQLSPYAKVRDRLYLLTGEQIRQAVASGHPIVPPGELGRADKIAEQISLSMSIGREARTTDPALLLGWSDVAELRGRKIRFSPRASVGVAAAPKFIDWDIADLFQAIKDGVLNVLNVTVQAIREMGSKLVKALKLTMEVANGVIEFLVDTIIAGFDAAASLFKSLGTAFDALLDWLGRVFSWERVQKRKKQIETWVLEGLDGADKWIEENLSREKTDRYFNEVKASLDAVLQKVRREYGSSSLGAMAEENGVTNADAELVGPDGSIAVEANWARDRILPSLGASSYKPTDVTAWDSVLKALQEFFESIGSTLTKLIDDVSKLFGAINTESGFFAVTVDVFVGLLEAAANALIDLFRDAVTTMIRAIRAIFASAEIKKFLTQEIEIPVISDILKLFGLAGSFSLLDVITVLVAVPYHVIVETFGGDAFEEATFEGAPCGLYLGTGIVVGVVGILSAIMDGTAVAFGPLDALKCTASLVVTFMTVSRFIMASKPFAPSQLGVVLSTFRTLVRLVIRRKDIGSDTTLGRAANVHDIVSGLCHLGLSLSDFASSAPMPTWFILGQASSTIPPIVNGGFALFYPRPPQPNVVILIRVAVDGLFYLGQAAANAVEWGQCPGLTSAQNRLIRHRGVPYITGQALHASGGA